MRIVFDGKYYKLCGSRCQPIVPVMVHVTKGDARVRCVHVSPRHPLTPSPSQTPSSKPFSPLSSLPSSTSPPPPFQLPSPPPLHRVQLSF